MAGYFKKRRTASPNKNDAKVRRIEAAAAKERSSPVLGQRFPDISRLTIKLRFHANGQDIRTETLVIEPNMPLQTRIPCPGQCAENGSFELTSTIETAAAARQARAEGNASCPEQLYAGLPQVCGCQLQAVIELSYRPKPAGI